MKEKITLKKTFVSKKKSYTVIATQDFQASQFGGPGFGHYKWAILNSKGELLEALCTTYGAPEGKITEATLLKLLTRCLEAEREYETLVKRSRNLSRNL